MYQEKRNNRTGVVLVVCLCILALAAAIFAFSGSRGDVDEEAMEAIRDAIADSGVKMGQWSPVYLTGGGLAINRGGREFLAAKLERTVRELPRKAVKLSSPAYSSALGLLDLLIDTTASARASGGIGGFFRSLFGG